jgi:hypothetical protein
VRTARRRLFAKFQRGTAPSFALAIALNAFEFRRRPSGVSAEQWVAFYDSYEAQLSQGWNDEEREAIEAKLLTIDGVIQVEKPRLPAPWPAYDKIVAGKKPLPNRNEVAAKIGAYVLEGELDARAVIEYERENKDRPEVVAELERIIGEHVPAEPPSGDLFAEELIEA